DVIEMVVVPDMRATGIQNIESGRDNDWYVGQIFVIPRKSRIGNLPYREPEFLGHRRTTLFVVQSAEDAQLSGSEFIDHGWTEDMCFVKHVRMRFRIQEDPVTGNRGRRA